jgi:hypothetical protein
MPNESNGNFMPLAIARELKQQVFNACQIEPIALLVENQPITTYP